MATVAGNAAALRRAKRLTDAQMLVLIRSIERQWKNAYGSPRMVCELRDRGVPAGKERVERLMRDNGIWVRRTGLTGISSLRRPINSGAPT